MRLDALLLARAGAFAPQQRSAHALVGDQVLEAGLQPGVRVRPEAARQEARVGRELEQRSREEGERAGRDLGLLLAARGAFARERTVAVAEAGARTRVCARPGLGLGLGLGLWSGSGSGLC